MSQSSRTLENSLLGASARTTYLRRHMGHSCSRFVPEKKGGGVAPHQRAANDLTASPSRESGGEVSSNHKLQRRNSFVSGSGGLRKSSSATMEVLGDSSIYGGSQTGKNIPPTTKQARLPPAAAHPGPRSSPSRRALFRLPPPHRSSRRSICTTRGR